jgi:hypothetical protein
VVSIVQDDIKGLNPIASFPDAVDNIIAINMLQEELTLMGQPYSDADLIIQHSNKMPNTDDFRALKMEFIDCDVSQFSTFRPTLTLTQPNPSLLRIHKTWDEYCHKVQRYNASEPANQPQSALSARMEHPLALPSAPSALAASSSLDLEATIRKILAETKPSGIQKREFSQQETDIYRQRQQSRQARLHASSQPPKYQSQSPRYQGQPPRQELQRQTPSQQRPPFQPQQSKPYQDQPRNQFRRPFEERQPQSHPYSNVERRPQPGNKRAFAAMESQDWEDGMRDDERSVYGAHQEYDDDGNYQEPYFAMSAATDHPQDGVDLDEDDDGENYAS